MCDIFHENVQLEFTQSVFRTMIENPQHTYQVLTKRSSRQAELISFLEWTPNIWMGVSLEDDQVMSRIDVLTKTCSHVKFI
jgi:protein gp37